MNKEINPFSFKAEIKVDDWGIIAPTVPVEKVVTKMKDVVRYKSVTPAWVIVNDTI